MTIVEYALVSGRTPDWITDGGHWGNNDANIKLIGTGVEGSIPEGTVTYTLAELQTRQLALHAIEPRKKLPVHADSATVTEDEVNAEIKVWWDARS
jgi:hypothetical protein